MNHYLTFETPRLIIRPTLEEDGLLIFQLFNSPKWLKFIGDRNVHSEAEGREYIKLNMLPQREKLGFSNYTVIRKADQVKLGTCGLYDRVGLEGIDIGFAFLPGFEKMGYGFEAAQEIKRAAIEEFGITLIKGITNKENIASQKLLEKLGFIFKELVKLPGEEEELFLYEFSLEKGEEHQLSQKYKCGKP